MLNALRHHGDKDAKNLCDAAGLSAVVLNALRHHGDKDHPQRGHASHVVRGLNALRHHGDKDRIASTP